MAGIPWTPVYIAFAAYAYLKATWQTFFYLSALATLGRIVYRVFLYPEFLTPLKQIPSPSGRSWLRGNSSTLILRHDWKRLAKWVEEIPNDGLIRYYMTGNLERLIVTSPKGLSEILVTKVYDFEKPALVRESLGRLTGQKGVLLVEGAEHKHQRKNLMPAFSYRHIKNLYPIFWSKSIEMVQCIEDDLRARENDSSDNVIRVATWSSRATLDIIGLAGMNRDFNSLRDPTNELARQYGRINGAPPSKLELGLFLLGLVMGVPTWVHKLPLKRNKYIREGAEYIRAVALQMLREAKDLRDHEQASNAKDGVDIMSVALESGSFTDEELVDQMMTFLAAGHETTSTALQWCVYALCKYPDVQTRLREEIRANLPSISVENPESVSAEVLDNLPYLHAVCNEVFRFHPSAPVTIRVANHDTSLVGQSIPKGTLIFLFPAIINHLKELWGSDADKFDPERWLGPGMANTGGATSNYAFLTFLHGPRSCIGQGFAKSELACMLAAFVGRFKFELENPDAELELREGATVSPRDGVRVRLTPLKGW
ncbi:cytochrome P450 [Aspergillus fijiensis CBS 313.89]|uniref:Cytochrome P450 monooxygenase n=1 Tax=Aspergillus fijiensis CBS 313.89 TaxID=1448319 RepID=A0A8G1RH17_9EURO|nr:cytochrome P450 monooxygenase [Aspergillus fijiensis CBS 313.89]RAK73074.1 cytochrome P450 monooxygenase [Aspergillus fijiensis CBS 313.89]